MPATAAVSAREILTGLHDVMASKASAQAKLNKVVKIIAEAMASEVCSIYLLRDGVQRRKDKITTESVVMRASTGTVRWVRGEHRPDHEPGGH